MGWKDAFNVTGEKGWGTRLVNSFSGAEGAKAQADAALKASREGRQFLADQALLGNQYLGEGEQRAADALNAGGAGSQGALTNANQAAMAYLGQGANTAAGYINQQ